MASSRLAFDLIRLFPALQPKTLGNQSEEEYYSADVLINSFCEELLKLKARDSDVDSRFLHDNIQDHSDILSRVVDYRSVIGDIEAARARAALSYSATLNAALADYELEIARYPGNQAVQRAAISKHSATIAAVDALQSRHDLDGGALNFNQRRLKVESYIKGELHSAYMKAMAVLNGLLWLNIPERLFESLPFPTSDKRTYVSFDGASFLDDWLAWNRLMVERLAKLRDREEMREVAISLGMKSNYYVVKEGTTKLPEGTWEFPDRPPVLTLKEGILVPDLVSKLRSRSKVSFNIKRFTVGWPFQGEVGASMGIRGVALSVSVPDEELSKWRFGASIELPDNASFSIASIPSMTSEIVWYSPPSLFNLDPRGTWSLELSMNPLHRTDDPMNAAQLDGAQWPLKDIQLYLKVAVFPPYEGTVDQEPNLGTARFVRGG